MTDFSSSFHPASRGERNETVLLPFSRPSDAASRNINIHPLLPWSEDSLAILHDGETLIIVVPWTRVTGFDSTESGCAGD